MKHYYVITIDENHLHEQVKKDCDKMRTELLKRIKNILVHMASMDELPLDMNSFDESVLIPAFKNAEL